MEGWTDGCGYLVESLSSVTVITSTFGLPSICEEEKIIVELFIVFFLLRRERESGERLGALENTESRGSCVWELPIPSR